MRRTSIAVAVTAALAVSGAPASAGPPTVKDLEKIVLTEADVPHGYRLQPESSTTAKTEFMVFGDDPCGKPGESLEVDGVSRGFAEDDRTYVVTQVAAPGAEHARALVKALATVPERCPKETRGESTDTYTRLNLPGLGKNAAAMVITSKGDEPDEGGGALVAAVVKGDVCVVFVLTEFGETDADKSDKTDDTEDFVKFVVAGAKKLERFG